MSNVLLLDTSFAARPIHDWLTDQGLNVWTVGNRPSDVLASRNPDRYLQGDYANLEKVQHYVDHLEIDYIVPGCTDLSIETALKLKRVKTRFDPPEVYQRLADKIAFRQLCLELDLPAPRRVELEELPYEGHVIAKPSDAFSGRGVSVFDGNDKSAGIAAYMLAMSESRNGEALLETYAEGQLYSYSCFLEDRKVLDAIFVREDGSVTPYAVDSSHVVFDFSDLASNMLRTIVERLAVRLELVDGLLHVQFIWDGTNIWLIELTRRCPGDLYPNLVELTTGWPYAARYASYFVNQPIRWRNAPSSRHILRHTVTAENDNYEGIWFSSAAPILEYHALAVTGRKAPNVKRIDRVALIFLEYQSTKRLLDAHDDFLQRRAYVSKI